MNKEQRTKELALMVLCKWYKTVWYNYKDHPSGQIRGMALKSKTLGLVNHDRIIFSDL